MAEEYLYLSWSSLAMYFRWRCGDLRLWRVLMRETLLSNQKMKEIDLKREPRKFAAESVCLEEREKGERKERRL